MSQPIVINIGAIPNDGTGDPLRTAFNDVNLNFANVFAYGPVLSNIQIANNTILTTNTNGNLILNPNGVGVVQANAHVVPDSTRIRNLGSSTLRWDTIYVQYANIGGSANISGNITAGSATLNGDLYVDGNLTVEGTTTTIDSTVVDIADKNITLAFGSPNAQVANGGGITIAGANAEMYYNYSGNNWTFNRPIATANIQFPDGSVLDTANTAHIGQSPLVKADGNLWFNSDDGRGYIKYNNQWLEFSPSVIPNPATYLGNLVIDGDSNSTLYFPPGGNIVFGDGSVQNTAWDSNSVNFTNVASSIIPSANATYSLGNSTRWWTNAWFSSNTIYIGGVALGVTGNILTVAGANVVTANAGGALNASDISVTGNVTANYFIGDGSQLTNLPAANTGNIGFTGDAIYGINGIYLENADLSHSATAAVVLPANGDTGAIQLNNTYGNIILQAGNTENITASWSFDNAGALNLPNGANIADSSFNAGAPSASVSLSAFSPDGNTVTIQAQGNTSSAVIKTYANSTSTTNQWKFDSNGKLTTAGETWVKSGDDYNSIVFSPNGTDNNGQIKVDSGTNMVVSAASNFYVKQAGSDRLAITNADTDLMASANVVIQSNKAGTANTWTFATNGRLIFPDGNTSIVRNPDTGRINFDAGVDGGGGISFGPTSNTYITGSQAVGIQAGFGNETAYNWTFGTDGTLSAPGNISTTGNITGNYILGDGSQLTNLPGGSSNYIENGTSSVAILSTDGNATIGVNATPVANFGVGQVSIIGNVLGNYFIGNGSQLTGLPATYGNANVAAYLPTYSGNLNAGNIISSGNANINLDPGGTGIVAIVGSASATGNIVTAGNFVGNGAALTNVTVSVAGNIVGTQPNVSLVAGSYTYTFDNTGIVTLPAPPTGNEGAEIDFTKAGNSTLLGNTVVFDQYVDRFRFFESGGNNRGVYIDFTQAAAGVNTLLNNRVSGFVNAGTFVTMDLIKATVTTSGQRALSLATTTGTLTYNIGATYALSGGAVGGASVNSQTLTTSATTSIFGWSFGSAGDTSTYILTDTTNSRCYRITLMVGSSYNNNMITIERLI